MNEFFYLKFSNINLWIKNILQGYIEESNFKNSIIDEEYNIHHSYMINLNKTPFYIVNITNVLVIIAIAMLISVNIYIL